MDWLDEGAIQDLEDEAAQTNALKAIAAAYDADNVKETYEKEMRCFRLTGVPAHPWGVYLQNTLAAPVYVQITLNTMIRLFSGAGYFNAVFLTLWERHASDYVGYVSTNLQGHLTAVALILR